MPHVGRLLMAIALGHAVVGVALFQAPLAAMLRDGLFDSVRPSLASGVPSSFDRAAAFWFLLFAPALFMLGQIVERAAARRDGPLLSLIGWHLLAIGLIGVVVIPISGFWTLLAVAPLLLVGARRAVPA